jgi:hypothetical protein
MRDFLARFVMIPTISASTGPIRPATAWQVLGGLPRRIRQECVENHRPTRIEASVSPRVVLEKSNALQQLLPKETTVFLAVN